MGKDLPASPRCSVSGEFVEPASFSCEIGFAEVTIRDRAALLGVLREIARRYAARIVCFDAEKLAGRAHAEAALRHAPGHSHRTARSPTRLRWRRCFTLPGPWECSAAVSFGLHDGENHLYVCCCPAPEGIWRDLAVHMQFGGEPDECISKEKTARLATLFDITPEEIVATGENRIRDLVLERVALLDVCK